MSLYSYCQKPCYNCSEHADNAHYEQRFSHNPILHYYNELLLPRTQSRERGNYELTRPLLIFVTRSKYGFTLLFIHTVLIFCKQKNACNAYGWSDQVDMLSPVDRYIKSDYN